MLILSHS